MKKRIAWKMAGVSVVIWVLSIVLMYDAYLRTDPMIHRIPVPEIAILWGVVASFFLALLALILFHW
jgi:tetrahydromethanopterin S-methyltransferase subunit E